jgi:carboxymethylenebutenolidase
MRDEPEERPVPGLVLNRREFVVTTLAVGFAAAVQPVRAETLVTTDTNGLTAGEVQIPAAGGNMPAYRAMPASTMSMNGAGFPTVLVVHEIFGVHEYIKDVCRRLAKLGYFAVAPDLFARQGDVSKITDIQEIVKTIANPTPDEQVMADLDATVAWAQASGSANTEKLGITGFCWGGRIVWLYAARSPKLKAGVAWYGRLASPSDALHPKQPIDVAAQLKAPVLGLYGADDSGIPIADVDKMRAALTAAKSPSEIVVFPGAQHGFHADYRPSYNPEAAKDGWDRLQKWFKSHGAG